MTNNNNVSIAIGWEKHQQDKSLMKSIQDRMLG